MNSKALIKRLNFDIILLFIIGIGILIRILNLGKFAYGPFEDRDLYRGVNYLLSPYFSGPEFSEGGATPGGGLYQLIYILTSFFGKNPLGLSYSINFLHISSILFSIYKLKQLLNTRVALLVGAYLSSTYMLIEYSQITMNPTFALPFLFLFMVYLLELILNKKKWSLLGCFASVLMASQMHFSFIVLLVIILFNILFLKIKLSVFDKISSFCFFIFSYLGYFMTLAKESNSQHVFFKDLIQYYAYFVAHLKEPDSLLLIYRNFLGLIYPSWLYHNANIDRAEFLSRPSICYYAFDCNHPYLSSLVLLATSAVLFFIFYYTVVAFYKKKSTTEKAIFLNFLFCIAFSILIYILGVSNIADFRRHMFIIPFICLAFSFGVTSFQIKYPKLNFIVYIYITIFFIINLTFVTITGVEKVDNYGFKKEVINVLQTKYGFTHTDLIRKVSLIAEVNNNNNNWQIYGIYGDAGYDLSGLEMLVEKTKENNNLFNNSDCVLVLWPSLNVQKKAEEVLSNVKYLPKLNVTKIEYGKKANYVFYKPWDAQCMGYYRNLYVYNKWDNLLFGVVDEIADDKQILKKMNNKNITLFFKKSDHTIHARMIARNVGTMGYMLELIPLGNGEYQILGYSTVPKNQRYGEASEITFDYSAARIKILLKNSKENTWQEFPLVNAPKEIKAIISIPVINRMKFKPGNYSLKVELDGHFYNLNDNIDL